MKQSLIFIENKLFIHLKISKLKFALLSRFSLIFVICNPEVQPQPPGSLSLFYNGTARKALGSRFPEVMTRSLVSSEWGAYVEFIVSVVDFTTFSPLPPPTPIVNKMMFF